MMTDGFCQKKRGIITYQQSYYLALESEPASQRGSENRNLAAATKRTFRLLQPKKDSEEDFKLTADKVLGGFRRREPVFSSSWVSLLALLCLLVHFSCPTLATSRQDPEAMPPYQTIQCVFKYVSFVEFKWIWSPWSPSSDSTSVWEVAPSLVERQSCTKLSDSLSAKPHAHLDTILEMSSSATMKVFLNCRF